jgi:hypothetical protein
LYDKHPSAQKFSTILSYNMALSGAIERIRTSKKLVRQDEQIAGLNVPHRQLRSPLISHSRRRDLADNHGRLDGLPSPPIARLP